MKFINLVLAFVTVTSTLGFTPKQVSAFPPTDLFISEYIEGSSNNKAIEIYNGTGIPVDLASGEYKLLMYFNGSASVGLTIYLSGTVADDDVFIIAHASANETIRAQADQTSGASFYNGDDAIALMKGDTVLDTIGQIGFDPGSEWGTGLTSTADNTLVRKATICGGDVDGNDVFNPAHEWDGYASDTTTYLGSHTTDCKPPTDIAPQVSNTMPANGSTGFALNATIDVTFSEAVTVTDPWFTIICSVSGPHGASYSTPDNITFTLTPNPITPFNKGEVCSTTILGKSIADRDESIDTMTGDYVFNFTTTLCGTPYTKINAVQGSGSTSSMLGQTITVEGIVAAYLPGMGGSYIQSMPGDEDDDASTSEGLFVYTLNKSEGDHVRVTGTVSEYSSNSYGSVAGMTELNVTSVETCAVGQAVVVTPLSLPIPDGTDPTSYLERYESMLVRFDQELTVQQNFFQGRFGQLTLGSGGRIFNPTNGTGGNYSDNIRRLIILDDGKTFENPNPIPYYGADGTLRAGDRLQGLEGILDQGRINSKDPAEVVELAFPNVYYRIHPIETPSFTTYGRPINPSSSNLITVSSFNVLNYFTTLDATPYPEGSPYTSEITPRGADSFTEFTRQETKLMAAAKAINADIFGLIEIEAWDSANAVASFTSALNTAIGVENTYDFIEDPAIGLGGNVIQQAILYKPATVTPIGDSLSISTTPFDLYRYPIAQLFEDKTTGDRLWVIVNHFKSKNCDPVPINEGNQDLGGGVGCYNATRVAMAAVLLAWIETDLAPIDADVLITGDLNSYGGEDAIKLLTGAGLIDQIADKVHSEERYTYIFDGMAGYLDHAIATSSLHNKIVSVNIWHINTDEPAVIDYNTEYKAVDLYQEHVYRSSDHDPVIISLRLGDYTTYLPLILKH